MASDASAASTSSAADVPEQWRAEVANRGPLLRVSGVEAELRELLGVLEDFETTRRALLILAELEEMAPREVCEALEVPMAMANARLRHARQAFEAAVRRGVEPGDDGCPSGAFQA
jgi:DNA-directed RNA polymerase specialized sigma24 family protein